jgi:hypothetical protein
MSTFVEQNQKHDVVTWNFWHEINQHVKEFIADALILVCVLTPPILFLIDSVGNQWPFIVACLVKIGHVRFMVITCFAIFLLTFLVKYLTAIFKAI